MDHLNRLEHLENRVRELQSRVRQLEDAIASGGLALRQGATTTDRPEPPETEPDTAPPAPAGFPRPGTAPGALRPASPAAPPSAEPEASGAAHPSEGQGRQVAVAFARAGAWLLGGNTVARVGVVVLFFGVAFFLNYAIDRGWLSVEARLILAAAGGLALAAGGWWLRDRRRDYALVLQGGGIGIVYLTVFAAANLYGLVSAGVGLAAMVVLVVLASTLAVSQDARSLAVLATLGGLLAPVLVSRDGSHVALFSYYAVLDVGVLAIAWFKAWRVLNLLGFVFTFIVCAAWGAQFYQPEYFATTEPFLVGFFLLYVAVPVLFARHQQARGTRYIDGTLLFGVPLVAFGLQDALVRQFEYGLALSALCTGVFYVALASHTRRRLAGAGRMLAEVFLALGVGFGTLAIPLAVDGRWTGAAWALEGAGLIWVGVRQGRSLARVSGILLQLAAGASWAVASLAVALAGSPRGPVVLNSLYLSALLISLAGLFSAWYLDRRRAETNEGGFDEPAALLAWGLLWWAGAGVQEIRTYVPAPDQLPAFLVFAAGSAAVLTGLRWPLAWRQLRVPALLLLPVMVVLAADWFEDLAHPLVRWGGFAWGGALAVHYWIQRRLEAEWPDELARYWHAGMLWLGVFLVSWEAAWLTGRVAGDPSTWLDIAWIMVPAAALVGVPPIARHVEWPFRRFSDVYLKALIPLAVIVTAWLLFTSAARGSPAPLPYVPLVNPLELAQGIVLAILLRWTHGGRVRISEQARWAVWSVLAFVMLNGIIARAVHFYSGVAFEMAALWSSVYYQTAVSIVWTSAALVAMVCATWLKQRVAWFAGAILLGIVVAKLFLVDLSDAGTVARIVSFLVVGALILLVGYLSPLPPQPEGRARA